MTKWCAWKKWHNRLLGGGFKYFFLFSSRNLGKIPILMIIFFKWVVQPPTRDFHWGFSFCGLFGTRPGGVLLKELRQHGWEGVHALIFILAKLYALPGEEGGEWCSIRRKDVMLQKKQLNRCLIFACFPDPSLRTPQNAFLAMDPEFFGASTLECLEASWGWHFQAGKLSDLVSPSHRNGQVSAVGLEQFFRRRGGCFLLKCFFCACSHPRILRWDYDRLCICINLYI